MSKSISFNCNEGGTNGGNVCPTSNYKVTFDGTILVTNQIPTTTTETTNLFGDFCVNPYPSISVRNYTLGWTFSDPDVGDTQDGYQIVIHQGSPGPTPPATRDFDTGH